MEETKSTKETIEGYIRPAHTTSIVGIFVVNAEPKIIHVAGQGQYSSQDLTLQEKETLNAMINKGELIFKIEENCLEPLPDGRKFAFAKEAIYKRNPNKPPAYF